METNRNGIDQPQSPSGSTGKEQSERSFFVCVSGFLVDFFLMSCGVWFNFTFLTHQPLIICAIVIVPVLKRNVHLRRNVLVNIVYLAFVLITVDVLVMLNAGSYAWNPVLLLIPVGTYFVALRFRNLRFLKWDWIQCLIVPVLATFLISSAGDAPESSEACGRLAANGPSADGIRLLISTDKMEAKGNKIRYAIQAGDSRKFLVAYRQGFTIRGPEFVPRVLDHIDLDTGAVSHWLTSGEAIAVHQTPLDGDVYAVVMDIHPRPGSTSAVELVRFDSNGRVKQRVPLVGPRRYAYVANVLTWRGKIVIYVEDYCFVYEPVSGVLKKAASRDSNIGFSMVQSGDYIYGATPHSPALGLVSYDNVKYDISKNEIAIERHGPLLGYYEIKQAGGKDNFIASGMWVGGGTLFDKDLNIVRRLDIPRGARNFAVDKEDRYLFAPNFFTGEMRVLDIASNKVLPGANFVGKGTRLMVTTNSGRILIANSCGIVEADPAVLLNGK